MTNSSLLSLVLLLLAVSPHAAARPAFTQCLSVTTYAANSTYEANLRRLATVLRAAASASQSSYAYRAVGFWPNRVQASSWCCCQDDGGGGSERGCHSSCAACIAGAFQELESTCPYHREAFFSDRNCTLQLSEVRVFRTDGNYDPEGNILKQTLASGLIFQVVGFAWLFFLLLQEWRGRKRGTTGLSTPLEAGDH